MAEVKLGPEEMAAIADVVRDEINARWGEMRGTIETWQGGVEDAIAQLHDGLTMEVSHRGYVVYEAARLEVSMTELKEAKDALAALEDGD